MHKSKEFFNHFIMRYGRYLVALLSLALILVRRDMLKVDFIIVVLSFLIIFHAKNGILKKVLLLALIIRVLFLLWDIFVMPLPETGPGSDAVMFEEIAWQWAEKGILNVISHFTSGAFMYSWVVAILYSFFGRNLFLVRYINVFISVVSILLVYRIAGKYLERKKLLFGFNMRCLSSINLFLLITYREVFIVFFIFLGSFSFLLWTEQERFTYILISELSFVLSMGFHLGMIIGIFIGALVSIVYMIKFLKKRELKQAKKSILVFIVISLIITVVFLTGFGFEKIPSELSDVSVDLAKIQITAARDRAAYLTGLKVQNKLDIILQFPIRFAYFLFAPFFWMVKVPIDIIGFLDGLMYLVLTILILFKFRDLFKEQKFACFNLSFLFFEIWSFSLTTS